MSTLLLPLIISLTSIGPALQFDPSAETDRIVTGQGTKATWHLFGDAKLTGEALETAKGGVRILNFVPSRTAFSIETIFRLDAYGTPEWNWLSDLVNTATWAIRDTIRPEQGFTLRIGGGYWYPELGSGAAVSEWSRRLALDYSSVHTSAKMSRCLLDFSMGPTHQKVWFEIFSDRCVEPGGWHHAVATWDGTRQRLFLDGEDVTDPWRIHRPDDVPRLDSGVVLNIGARALSSLDFRYLDGSIRLVSVLPKALGDSEVSVRYRTANLRPVPGTCAPTYRIASPLAFQGVGRSDVIDVRKLPGALCTNGIDTTWNSADSIEIQAMDSTLNILSSLRIASSTVQLSHFEGLANYNGLLYFRLKPLAPAANAAGIVSEWSNILPSLHVASASSIKKAGIRLSTRTIGPRRYLLLGSSDAKIKDASGRTTASRIESQPGGILVDLSKNAPGLYMAISANGSSILVNP